MREKCDMASRELDSLRFGPATHEALKLGIDHTILCGDDRIARFLRPRRCRDLGLKRRSRDWHLRDGHEMRRRLRQVSGKVLAKRFLFDSQEAPPDGPDARSRWRALL